MAVRNSLLGKALFLCLLAVCVSAQQTKKVIISSILVKDTHETVSDPSIRIRCYQAASRNGNRVAVSESIEMLQVRSENIWYVVEREIFTWDPSVHTPNIFCEVYEDDIITTDTLGETADFGFDSITYEGAKFDTTIVQTQASFYLRCGDCAPPNPEPIDQLLTKTIALKAIQISDTMENPLSDPDIYMQCLVAGSPTSYSMNLPEVNNKDKEYTINTQIPEFAWTVGFTANGTLLDGSMLHSGTCGIYERDTTDKDDGLGVVIIRFTEITPDGKKYVLANDPNSYIVLSDCTDPSACSGAATTAVSIVALFVAVLVFIL